MWGGGEGGAEYRSSHVSGHASFMTLRVYNVISKSLMLLLRIGLFNKTPAEPRFSLFFVFASHNSVFCQKSGGGGGGGGGWL